MKVAAHGDRAYGRPWSAKAPVGQISITLRIHQRSARQSIRRRRHGLGHPARRTNTGARNSGFRQVVGIATKGYFVCGRFTVKATWAELVALYRLTLVAPEAPPAHANWSGLL